RPVADRQRASVIAGRRAEPALAVVGGDRLVVLPAAGIGGAAGIDDGEFAIAAARAGEAEMEPLVEVRLVVLADDQAKGRSVAVEPLDIARVEAAVDLHGAWNP